MENTMLPSNSKNSTETKRQMAQPTRNSSGAKKVQINSQSVGGSIKGTGQQGSSKSPSPSSRNTSPNDLDDDRFYSDDRFGSEDRFDRSEQEHFTATSNLTAPPAREGMVQRWVNVDSSKGTNIARKNRQGWTPRPSDTLPKGWEFMATKTHSTDLGVIQVAEHILMEMPIERNKRIKEAYREKREFATAAVKDRPREDPSVAGIDPKYGGLTWERYEVKESGRSRRVHVADD